MTPQTTDTLERILRMIQFSHKLKTEGRHCWYENGRRESVAEHVWCMSFMAILLAPHLSQPVDMEKVLKMIVLHDLVEAEAGDTPFFLSETFGGKALKEEKEKKAMNTITNILDSATGEEIKALWQEFEERSTFEARFCVALDKLEANIQHNNSPLDTWTDKDRQRVFDIAKYCNMDPIIEELNRLVVAESVEKMKGSKSRLED